jgi:Holliday junction DNA helicase RuvA
MIHYLNGKLTEINPAYVVVECNGVGYLVNISLHTFGKIQSLKEAKLLTHFIVRDDGQFLYGFAEDSERQMFKLLLGVSGVGANTARMILSAMNPSEVYETITSNDANRLKSVKGIGLKTAQRIIVDLRDKVDKNIDLSENISDPHNTIKQEALSALVQLGFSRMAADKVLNRISTESGSISSVEEMIRLALKYL